MKRPITNLVMGWLAFFLSVFQLNAQTTFAVDPQNISGTPGDQITVNITVSGFTNILSFQYSMSWNPSILQFVGPVGLPGNLTGLAASSFGTNNAANGVITASWLDPDVAGVTLPSGTILYSLTFNVLSASGTTIAFGGTPTSIEVTNSNGGNVNFVPVNGIVNGGGGGGNNNLIINAIGGSAPSGGTICVDFAVENFNDILNFQYSMHFNPAVLQFTGVGSLNLPGLLASNFGTNNAGTGLVTVSWADPDVMGVTAPGGTVIYELCFNVIGSSGQSSAITIDGTPTSIEVVNGNSQNVGLTVNAGNVTVSGGNPPPPINGFAILASDDTVQNGQNFCIDFAVNDFNDILSMQYSMNYDPTQLQLQATPIQGLNLEGLNASLFNTAVPGTITMSWLDPNVQGITLTNGTVIYQICFVAIGQNNCNNSNQLTFGNSPTSIEILDGNENPVTFNSSPGVTTICDDPGGGGGGPTYTDLTFVASSETELPGQQLCVDIQVYNFDCVVSAQYSMHWNPAVLQYNTIQNLGLPGLTISGNFGEQSTSTGTLNVSWLDPNTTGVTLNDGAIIYTVCFNVIGTLGQTSQFTFDGNPTSIEVTDCLPGADSPDFVAGTQTVGSNCPGPVSITNAVATNITCFGANTGSVDISVSGGNNSYTYSWTNAGGTVIGTNQDVTGLAPGTYTVVVRSCNGAQMATATYTITQPSSGITVGGTATPVICFGETTGTVNITPTGGTTSQNCGYTYLWSNGATTQDLANRPAGTYVVTVTDCNNCQATSSFTVSGPPSELVVETVVVNSRCNAQCNGSITVNASGGVGPYQFMLNTGAFQSVNEFNNLCPGSYLVKVRDSFGCVKSTQVVITTPPVLALTATVTNATAGNNGTIDITVTGGVSPYNYAWADGPITQDRMNLVPGDYCVTVTDDNDCTASLCRTVQAPLVLTGMNVKPSCFGQCTGRLEVVFTGGSAPYTYAWSGGIPAGNPTPSTLCPGTYTVTVTSSDGQTATLQGTVNGASMAVTVGNPVITLVSLPGVCDGGVSVSVGGGFPPYTYNWSNGATSNPATNVCEGNFFVTVTDLHGCTGTSGPHLVFYDPDPLEVLEADNVIICAKDSAVGGTLKVSVIGGLEPYTFVFTGGPGTTTIPTIDNNSTGSVSIPNVHHGIYTVSITDSAPAPFTQTIQTTVNMRLVDLSIDPVVITPTTNGGSNGGVNITPTGGDPLYTYQWNAGSPSTNQDLTGVPAGTYDVFIQETNGCVEQFTGLVITNFSLNSVLDKTDCPTTNNGSISLNPAGSNNLPLTYQWSNGAGNVSSISGLGLGVFTVTVTDAIGTSIVESFTISPESNLTATISSNSPILCHGEKTGTATVTPANGTLPYTYLWNTSANMPTLTGLGAGGYSVLVTDGSGCSITRSVTIEQLPMLSVNVATTSGGDCTEGNGRAIANVAGGTFPYNYFWNDGLGQTSKTAILLDPGTYTVTVVDANNCEQTASGLVQPIEPLEVEGSSIPDSGGPSGQAMVVVNSGTPPFEFEWQGSIEQNSILTELEPGTYFVKVTDANGCEQILSIRVDSETDCDFASVVITPEGDGYNERFQIGCLSRYPKNKLEIFNRWGQSVFLANDYNNGRLWEGTDRRGEPVPDGVYFYVFDYTDPATGQEGTLKGAVTVQRN